MTKSLVITYDEGSYELDPDNIVWTVAVQDITTYDQLNEALKGWIEAIPTDNRVTVWCNEEGKLNNLPYNPVATKFWRSVDHYGCVRAGDWIAGPVVIQGPVDSEGNNTDCPDWVIEQFSQFVDSPTNS